MTAYGRACVDVPLGHFVAELQSVNRRHLEINVALPKELLCFDVEIKKWISSIIDRGQITARISAAFNKTSPLVATPNLPLAKQLKAAWERIIHELELDPKKSISPELLALEPGLINYDEDLRDESLYLQALKEVVSQALQQLLVMKKKEGEALHLDISSRIDLLKKWIHEIAEKAPDATVKYRQRLTERLEEFLAGSIENEEKILREVLIYAERIDIAEEITRFQVHLHHLVELMNSGASSVGKKMEFLIQELGREANTMSSKSPDVDISSLIVNIKSELERIREQVQNIE
jgi:uncharacterized protein (TIGR00255 family)